MAAALILALKFFALSGFPYEPRFSRIPLIVASPEPNFSPVEQNAEPQRTVDCSNAHSKRKGDLQ